ncbi:MAG TPA: HAD family hydrolase, partial [Candidatus Thermoplasmatota archaeon]
GSLMHVAASGIRARVGRRKVASAPRDSNVPPRCGGARLPGRFGRMIRLLALDADDTLWHNEPVFTDTLARFTELLRPHAAEAVIEQRLHDTEIRNLQHYGYGVKAFTLSMIETAVELTGGRVGGEEVRELLRMGREMLVAPVELLDGVREAVAELARTWELMLLTKGDLLDQETKLARSGLGEHFTHVEVVARKDRATYERIVGAHGLAPREFVMVGDSLRSDVVPVAEMGGHAIHVPYATSWAHERVEPVRLEGLRYLTVARIAQVGPVLRDLGSS